jgi:hypothetical protein
VVWATPTPPKIITNRGLPQDELERSFNSSNSKFFPGISNAKKIALKKRSRDRSAALGDESYPQTYFLEAYLRGGDLIQD